MISGIFPAISPINYFQYCIKTQTHHILPFLRRNCDGLHQTKVAKLRSSEIVLTEINLPNSIILIQDLLHTFLTQRQPFLFLRINLDLIFIVASQCGFKTARQLQRILK